MGISRNILLWASRNEWLKQNVPKMKFVRKALKRFMPGETLDDAVNAAKELKKNKIPTTFTHLGENITTLKEAEANTQHYLDLLDRIKSENLDIEISLKLTQLGFDISFERTLEYFAMVTEKAYKYNNSIFIDMEDSSYVDRTIQFYKKVKESHQNVGLCLQAYLRRTMNDLKGLTEISPWIRLVKGAYKELSSVAFKKLIEVNTNYFSLAQHLLRLIEEKNIRVAFGTHDANLQEQIRNASKQIGLPKERLEFQMLYGIKTSEQFKLTDDGYNIRTLISYGNYWYPWYARRLAERPANVWFVLKNIFNN